VNVRSGWRLRSLLFEGISNVRASMARSLVLGAALCAAFIALAFAELSFSGGLEDQARTFAAAGGYVAVVSGPDGVSGADCALLGSASDAVSAGAVRTVGETTAGNAPEVAFRRLEATSGLVQVWDPSTSAAPGPGMIFGASAADELGLKSGSWVSVGGAPATQVGVIHPEPRGPFGARAVIDIVSPAGRFDECWVEYDPATFATRLRSLPAAFAPDEVDARRVVDRGQFALDPAVLFADRPQRWGWLPLGLIGAAMVALMAIFRRSEMAVYRAYGLPRVGLMLLHQVETLLVLVAALLTGLIWAVLIQAVTSDLPSLEQVWIATTSVTEAAAVVLVLGPLGGVLAARGDPSILLRDR